MNIEEARKRIESGQETSQSEAIAILRRLLTDFSQQGRDDDEALFEAGTLALSLVDLWDCSESATAWKDDEQELLDYLVDLIVDWDHAESFNDFLRRLIDRKDVLVRERGEDYEIESSRFSSVQEALAALPSVEKEVLEWEREQADKKREVERASKTDAERPLSWQEKKSRKRKLNLWKSVGLALVCVAVYAAFQHDWYFFILLFILLFEIGLVYGAESKGYVKQLKELAAIVGGFAFACVFAAVVTLLYLAGTQEYRMLGSLEPITSKSTLIATYRERQGEVFVSGVVGEENQDYGEDGCAVFTRRVRGGAEGSTELLVDLADGIVPVTGHLLDKNSRNRDVRVGWQWEGMTGRAWQCLRIGRPVSVRGFLQGAHSVDGTQTTVSISAEEVFPGNSNAHASYLRQRMPDTSWSIFMARASVVIFAVFISVLVYYSVRLIALWLTGKRETGGV